MSAASKQQTAKYTAGMSLRIVEARGTVNDVSIETGYNLRIGERVVIVRKMQRKAGTFIVVTLPGDTKEQVIRWHRARSESEFTSAYLAAFDADIAADDERRRIADEAFEAKISRDALGVQHEDAYRDLMWERAVSEVERERVYADTYQVEMMMLGMVERHYNQNHSKRNPNVPEYMDHQLTLKCDAEVRVVRNWDTREETLVGSVSWRNTRVSDTSIAETLAYTRLMVAATEMVKQMMIDAPAKLAAYKAECEAAEDVHGWHAAYNEAYDATPEKVAVWREAQMAVERMDAANYGDGVDAGEVEGGAA